MSYLLLQFLWPDGRAQSTDVNIEEWWSTIDRKMEAAAFSSAKQESRLRRGLLQLVGALLLTLKCSKVNDKVNTLIQSSLFLVVLQ